MELKWKDQKSSKEFTRSLEAGQCIFMVGANGSGKSAFLQKIVSENSSEKIERISAHTQTWLNGGISITGNVDSDRQTIAGHKSHIDSYEKNRESRWRDLSRDRKLTRVLTELIFKKRAYDLDFEKRINNGEIPSERPESERPFTQLDELLRHGGFPISLETDPDNIRINVRHRNSTNAEPYGIEQMSDGERRAVLIASTVLVAEERTVLLIDEPEQHLHPAITVPFFSELIEQRRDCIFIFSTHDITLPLAIPNAGVLCFQKYNWMVKNFVDTFNIDILDKSDNLPEDLKQDILGARDKILFVEGEENSLDLKIYSALFPNFRGSIKPKGNYHDVERSVNGLKKTESLHYVKAFGLVDRDFRHDGSINTLVKKGVKCYF